MGIKFTEDESRKFGWWSLCIIFILFFVNFNDIPFDGNEWWVFGFVFGSFFFCSWLSKHLHHRKVKEYEVLTEQIKEDVKAEIFDEIERAKNINNKK